MHELKQIISLASIGSYDEAYVACTDSDWMSEFSGDPVVISTILQVATMAIGKNHNVEHWKDKIALLQEEYKMIEEFLTVRQSILWDYAFYLSNTFESEHKNDKKKVMPVKTDKESIHLAIVIALQEEFRVLFPEIEEYVIVEHDEETGEIYYLFNHSVNSEGTELKCLATLIGNMGEINALRATERMLIKYNPSLVALLGISAGIHTDVRLGDVIIASQVDSYAEASAVRPDKGTYKLELGGTIYNFSYAINKLIENYEFLNKEAIIKWKSTASEAFNHIITSPDKRDDLISKKMVRDNGEVSYQISHIASGPFVIKSTTFQEIIKLRDRNIKAADMESGGVLASTTQRLESIPTIILRGISDFGDERKNELENDFKGAFRSYAMNNTMNFLLGIIKSGFVRKLMR